MKIIPARFSGGRFRIECPACRSAEECGHYLGRTIEKVASIACRTVWRGDDPEFVYTDVKGDDVAVRYGWALHVYRPKGRPCHETAKADSPRPTPTRS